MTLNEWVPWLIFAGNCGSLMLTMRGKPLGFWVLIAAQVLFAGYAWATDQTGFLAQNLVMTLIAIQGIIRWRRQGVHYSAKERKDGNPSPN